MAYDYTLVLDQEGIVTAHKPGCPDVGTARNQGRPLLTMFDCVKPLGDAYRRHSCLEKPKKAQKDEEDE